MWKKDKRIGKNVVTFGTRFDMSLDVFNSVLLQLLAERNSKYNSSITKYAKYKYTYIDLLECHLTKQNTFIITKVFVLMCFEFFLDV